MSATGCPADDQTWDMAKLSKGLWREQKIIEVGIGLSSSLLIYFLVLFPSAYSATLSTITKCLPQAKTSTFIN